MTPGQPEQKIVTQPRLYALDEYSGTGTPQGTIVLVHGTPSSSREYRQVIDGLKATHRCLAVDHLGFGQSDRPPAGDYSVPAHAQRFAQWMDRTLPQDRVTLVVHDFGGPIALPWAMKYPARVARLVILNTWFWPFEVAVPEFASQKRWLDNAVMRFLYLRLNFSARVMVKSSWGKAKPLTREKHREYLDLFPTPESRLSTWALAQFMANDGGYFTDYEKRLTTLAKVQTAVVWGMGDKFFKPAHRDLWLKLLPHAESWEVPRAGHFLQDECPEAVIPAILNKR